VNRARPYLLSAPAAALLVGLLLGPLVLLLRVSLYEPAMSRGFFTPGTWTLANFAAVLDRYGLRLLGFTTVFGIGVAAVSVSVAYPLAFLIRSLSEISRRVAVAGVLLPKLASVLVVVFGLQQLLSAAGPVSQFLVVTGVGSEPVTLSRTLFAAVLTEAYLILPYAVLVLLIQLQRIDPTLEAAARGLGAGRWGAFRRVTLPLSLPGVVLAGQLGLVWGMGAFLGPMFLGGPEQVTLSVEVYRQAFEYNRWPRAAAGAVVLLVAVGGCLGGYSVVTRRVRGAA
jgi:ABC-type spermidine/putrescine transport system permease subunit I